MRKPEDSRIPITRSMQLPKVYDQNYVDCLKSEVEHYKKLYRDLLVKVNYAVK